MTQMSIIESSNGGNLSSRSFTGITEPPSHRHQAKSHSLCSFAHLCCLPLLTLSHQYMYRQSNYKQDLNNQINLIGEDQVYSCITRDVKRIEWGNSIFGLYLSLDSQQEYKSGKEIDKSAQIHISPPTRIFFKDFLRMQGNRDRLPANPPPIMSNGSMMDSSRVPPGNT